MMNDFLDVCLLTIGFLFSGDIVSWPGGAASCEMRGMGGRLDLADPDDNSLLRASIRSREL